jgi:N-acetylneuraminic acid mutarotase
MQRLFSSSFGCCLLVFAGMTLSAGAQTTAPNEWTWMGGNNTVPADCSFLECGSAGVYGTLGTPAPANNPGSRNSSATWIDQNGNLWLFGGVGFDANENQNNLNDLWEFNPATNQWAWISGSSTGGEAGVYGALGTAAATNPPGARNTAASWIDNSGNFWLFGGSGVDSAGTAGNLNDLWEFNPATNLWTWWGGSSSIASTCSTFFESVSCGPTGVYGTTGTAAPGNIPGGRNSAAFWTDNSGNFWLFGGTGLATTNTPGFLNDLWMFDPSTKEWTWMGGNNTLIQLSCNTSVTEPFCAYG